MSRLTVVPELGRLRQASKAQVAEFFDVSLPAVEGWIRRGCPVVQRGSRGTAWVMDLLAVAQWRFGGQTDSNEVDPDSLSPAERKAWYDSEVKKRELQVNDRELIPAAEVEQAIATAFAAISQDLRAIPDNLERRHGVSPAVAEHVERALLDAMDALADRLANLAPAGALVGGEGEGDEA